MSSTPYGPPDPSVGFTDHHLFPGAEPIRVDPAHGTWLVEASNLLGIAWENSWNDEANQLQD